MANHGGRRRNEWEQWNQAGSGRRRRNAMHQDFHVKRGQAYTHHIAEETPYNRDFRTQVPQFQRMPAAMPGCCTSNTSFAMPPVVSNHTLMQNAIGWGSFHHPPAPVSNHVQVVLDNILRLQCMGPVQAELMLKFAAAQQGPYTD
ncbi:unnamed protein product [Symbiodinium sp. CCMP2456]|nr:unnamed protein product [Symbiodinium sp. CCMP2456]